MFLNRIAVVLAVCIILINGEDPGVPHQHYLKAFENLPTLFEHIIDMLQEKPEILEKNDITTFLEFAAADDGALNPGENELYVFKRESNLAEAEDNIDKGTIEGYNNKYLLKADSNFEGFVGSIPGDFGLTAEEVAERMIMAERKLEEYYNDTH